MEETIAFTKQKNDGTVVKKKVPVFRHGDWKDWLNWLLHVQEHSTFMRYSLTQEDQFSLADDMQLLLFGEDLRQFNDAVREEAPNRPEVAVAGIRQLTMRHCPPGTRGALMDELVQLRKKKGDTVRQYSGTFRTLLRMIPLFEHAEDAPIPETDVVRMYQAGMPINWQVEVNRISRRWELSAIEAQFELIERNERDEALLRGNRQKNPDHQQNGGKNSNRGSNQGNSRQQKEKYCKYCKRNNHADNECRRNPDSPAYRPYPGNQRGAGGNRGYSGNNHGSNNNRGGNSNAMAVMEERLTEVAAMVQSIKRHQDDEFAAMNFYSTNPAGSMAAMGETKDSKTKLKQTDPCMEIVVEIGKRKVRALLDTGCATSAIDHETVNNLKPNIALRPESALYKKADGSTGMTTHCATTAFRMIDFSSTRTCAHEFRVAKKLIYPVMFGRDFMRDQRMVINFELRTIEWDGITISMDKTNSTINWHAAVLQEDTECRSEIVIEDQLKTPLEDMIEGQSLSADERSEVVYLVKDFEGLFSGALGTMKRPPYELPLLPEPEPFACRPFPIPRAYYYATRAEVQHLIDEGVLERNSDSPWASPAFVIPKKDGRVRLVCDFRKLNKQLRRHYYPTKDVKELQRSLSKPRYMSAFDVPMSYYACLLAKKNRQATAIITPFGKFVFLRLPMGVSTAPDEFQAAMDDLLGDLDYVRVYLDDILGFSSSFTEHLVQLREVFSRLKEAGLTLHPKKSKICADMIEYLGYQLTTDGIQAMSNKVEAITAIAPPKNRRELRRFVGMINFYRDMLPRRAEVLTPLTRLTSPAQPFRWTNEQQDAFENVKQALCENVLLVYPTTNVPYHVFTDASKLQLGAVITQENKPLGYWSKKCNKAQTAYPANRLKLLSIVLLLREFRSLLLGQELHLHTDHLNLTYSTFHDIHMMRWRLEIEEFGPILHYVPGEENVVADALSRLPVREETGTELEEKEKLVINGGKRAEETFAKTSEMAAATLQEDAEPFTMNLRDVAAAQMSETNLGPSEKQEIGGVMVLVNAQTKKVLVPKSIRRQLLNAYHDWLIHPGAATMKNTIAQVFSWEGMEKDVQSLVDGCIPCLKAKHPTVRYGKLPPKSIEVWPWFEIAVDSISPYGTHKFRALSIIDTATRLIELLPAQDPSSAEAAYLTDRHWLCRYPRPVRCIHDGGSEFKLEFAELLESYGIESVPTTTRNPQANAVIERVHRVIGEKMRTQEITTAQQWEAFLHNFRDQSLQPHHY